MASGDSLGFWSQDTRNEGWLDALNSIPIYITLTYGFAGSTMKFPINPEELKKIIPSESKKVNSIAQGEISVPQKPSLAEITIDSFFWNDMAWLIPPAVYIMWLEHWQNSKEPALLIVTRLNYSMWVTCEHFEHSVKAGEENDYYFKLTLKEYRHYEAKKISATPIPEGNWFEQLVNSASEFITDTLNPLGEYYSQFTYLVDFPRPSRWTPLGHHYENPYTVAPNETLSSIAKKITGDEDKWTELYNTNKELLGDLIVEEGELTAGLKLTLPEDWID